ncbi:MAG: protein kinase domain-containing protein [Candidatus Acidiferrales bacterium]
MTLAAGTKLGPYEIAAPVGAGGMGEVYRATDTRLGRRVAIKILPSHISEKPSMRERFEREARAISSLQHPNICTVYDVGRQDGVEFIVMEYLEGETLARRLTRGALPTEQMLKRGIEICEGLEKAHRSGILHRDLKPGNIMLTKTGAKLLDFGLAKPFEAVSSGSATSLPTSSKALVADAENALTAEGVVVGTSQYMSPEQLQGEEADARSDIFALGAVLYEMATGRRAFEGKSGASVAAAILEREPPPISSLQPMSPPALDHAVKLCLAKNPEERWQSAHDVKVQLQWIAESGSQAGQPTGPSFRLVNRERMAWLGTILVLLACLAATYLWKPVTSNQPTWSYILPPEKTTFSYFGGPVAVSPDGRKLAFVARAAEGVDLLWVRPLDAPSALPLAGTEGTSYPFWSPDSQFLGFFAGGKLKTVSASGGPVLTLCDAAGPRGGAWGKDGTILFSFTWGGIQRVPASGGVPVAITKPDPSRNELSHRWPVFLPDGRHFFYLAANFTGGPSESASVYVATLDFKENKLLFHARSNVAYTSGYLLFDQQGTLMARPFDEKGLELSGEAFPIAEHVHYNQLVWRGVFSASASGVLAYMGGATGNPGQLIWFDRSGKQLQAATEPGDFVWQELSTDGQRVAAQTLDSSTINYEIRVWDLPRGTNTRLTFGPWRDQSPVWSPDSKTIAYATLQNGRDNQLLQKKSDGTGGEEVLAESGGNKFVTSWSADGKFIAYNTTPEGKSNSELWILPLSGDRKPFAFLQTNSNVAEGRFCPRGGWIAYSSDESGRSEVYVTSFPGHQGKWQISQSGGSMPRWRHDGKELFYLAPNSQLMAAEVNWSGSTFDVAAVHPLFHLRLAPGPPLYDLGPTAGQVGYDVSPDGQRILVNSPVEADTSPITVILNWPAGLTKR